MTLNLLPEQNAVAEISRLRALVLRPVSLRETLGVTPLEEAVLRELLARHPVVTSRAEMLLATGSSAEINTIEVQVCRMRAKLDGCGLEVKTVRGRGWVLEDDTAKRLMLMVGRENACADCDFLCVDTPWGSR